MGLHDDRRSPEPLHRLAHASGRREEALRSEAIAKVHARSGGQPVGWCSDGWRAYPGAIRRTYRQPLRTGRPGRPPLRVPEGLSLTQTIKHRDEHRRLLEVETRAAIGAPIEHPVPVHIERLNGVFRDRLASLTRKTHAFAKSVPMWDALFWGGGIRAQVAAAAPGIEPTFHTPGRRYERRTPAMAIGLSVHSWSWREFLTTKATVSS